MSWPPGTSVGSLPPPPSTTSGSRFARDAYRAAVRPAGPDPRMTTRYLLFFGMPSSVYLRPRARLEPVRGRAVDSAERRGIRSPHADPRAHRRPSLDPQRDGAGDVGEHPGEARAGAGGAAGNGSDGAGAEGGGYD